MAGRHSFAELRARMSLEAKDRAEDLTTQLRADMDLAELRQALKLSQAELAKKLNVGQAAVAKVEQRADMYVSTLRGYIEAIGGELEISAKIKGRRVQLKNFQQLTGLHHPRTVEKDEPRHSAASAKKATKQIPVRSAATAPRKGKAGVSAAKR